MKANATNCIFINDSHLLVTSADRAISLIKVSSSIFGISARDSSLGIQRSFVRQLIVPPAYRPANSIAQKPFEPSKIISPYFSNIVGIVFFDKLVIAKITNEISVLAEYPCEKGVASFFMSNSETLYFSFANRSSLHIYSYVQGGQPEKVFDCILIGKQPSSINFLSESMVAVVFEDNSTTIYYYAENTTIQTCIPYQGILTQWTSSFYVISQDMIHELFLLTFQDSIDAYQRDHKVKEAITFANRAMKGDPDATVGLPTNQAQRSLIIERTISKLLIDEVRSIVQEKSAKEALDFVMPVCAELGLQEWLIRTCLPLFDELGRTNDFFERIIETDPNGTLFTYTPEFVDRLIESDPKRDITKFLEGLPSKAASASTILKYAVPHHSSELIANVYLGRLQDPVSAVSVYELDGNFDKITDVILTGERWGNREFAGLINWLFSMKDGHFIRAESVYKYDQSSFIEMISTAASFVERTKRPMELDKFFNALVILCQHLGANEASNKFYKEMENIVANKEFKLSGYSIKFMAEHAFTDVFSGKDQREEVVLSICSSIGYQMSMIPLCRKYGFTKAERKIYEENHDYKAILHNLIAHKEDPWPFVQKHHDIETIKPNATALGILDMAALMRAIEPQDALEISRSMEGIVRLAFLKLIIQKQKPAISDEEVKMMLPFYCKHYPNDVCSFVQNYAKPEFAAELIPFCDERRVTEGSALLAVIAGDAEHALDYIMPMWNTPFALDIISKIVQNKMLTDDLATKFFTAMAYQISTSGYNSSVQLTLNDILAEMGKVITVGRLAVCIAKGLAGVDQKTIKNVVKSFLLDKVIDAEDAHLFDSNGLTCAKCQKPLYDGSVSVKVRNCGHCFHNTESCLDDGKCPKCDEKDDVH